MDINWGDVVDGALAFFLVIVGIGIAYVCFRLGSILGRMTVTVNRVTDEVVPILTRAQTTVDGINLELERVDEIMVSAVNATKGAEKTVTTFSNAVSAPVRKASGYAAAAKEAFATFRAKRAALAEEAAAAEAGPPPVAATPVPAPVGAAQPPDAAPSVTVEHHGNGAGMAAGPADLPPEVRNRARGPSISQISWALPKRGS